MSGTLVHSPADVMRGLLVVLGLGSDDQDDDATWPVYAFSEPNTPDNMITTYNTAGRHHGRSMIDGEVQEHEGVQIRVRSTDPVTGYTKADAIAKTLDTDVAYGAVTISTSVYRIYAVSRRSGVLSLGKQPGTNLNLFTINVTVSMRQES